MGGFRRCGRHCYHWHKPRNTSPCSTWCLAVTNSPSHSLLASTSVTFFHCASLLQASTSQNWHTCATAERFRSSPLCNRHMPSPPRVTTCIISTTPSCSSLTSSRMHHLLIPQSKNVTLFSFLKSLPHSSSVHMPSAASVAHGDAAALHQALSAVFNVVIGSKVRELQHEISTR
jgi:hypothetical protein